MGEGGGRFRCRILPCDIPSRRWFYPSSKENWICLKLCSSKVLKNKCGIMTVFEGPKAVGTTAPKGDWKNDVFPHIIGGIPVSIPGIVTKVFSMKRDPTTGTFLSITRLTDE